MRAQVPSFAVVQVSPIWVSGSMPVVWRPGMPLVSSRSRKTAPASRAPVDTSSLTTRTSPRGTSGPSQPGGPVSQRGGGHHSHPSATAWSGHRAALTAGLSRTAVPASAAAAYEEAESTSPVTATASAQARRPSHPLLLRGSAPDMIGARARPGAATLPHRGVPAGRPPGSATPTRGTGPRATEGGPRESGPRESGGRAQGGRVRRRPPAVGGLSRAGPGSGTRRGGTATQAPRPACSPRPRDRSSPGS